MLDEGVAVEEDDGRELTPNKCIPNRGELAIRRMTLAKRRVSARVAAHLVEDQCIAMRARVRSVQLKGKREVRPHASVDRGNG